MATESSLTSVGVVLTNTPPFWKRDKHLCHEREVFLHTRQSSVDNNLQALWFHKVSRSTTFDNPRLTKVYDENDKFSERWYAGWENSKSLALYIDNINSHYFELEESLEVLCSTESLSFKKPGDENEDLVLRWSGDNLRNAVDLLSSNLNKLDDYVSTLVVKYRKPSKASRHLIYYTFGAIGVSVFSLWLLRHSRLSGVVHNLVLEAKESVTRLFVDQVKQLSLVNRHKELMKLRQVQSTRDFSFEKELKYPTQNLGGEDSAQPMLNQIQKLKLDVKTARELFEMNHQILMASERNLATLATIPAIGFSLGGLMISCTLVKQVLGEGRSARAQRRLLVKEVEERFKEFQKQCLPSDRHCNHGLILCTLDRLYRAVESSAKKTGEWESLREDVIALGKLNYSDSDKLMVISHLKGTYVCLFPPPPSGSVWSVGVVKNGAEMHSKERCRDIWK